ncbi:MAG: glycosyltransferase [Calditrichaceae bacterium]|nr:glycosyltransferase [Calditrichaceae bacterium]
MNTITDNKLSVIIVVYNQIKLIRKTLLSLNRQSVLPAEVVLSDDGSSCDIPAGINDLLPELQFNVKFVRQEDRGFRAGKCRNNGIRECSGEYLVFFDQDILSTTNYLKVFSDHQRKNSFIVAFPVLLSEEQTKQITEPSVRNGRFLELITREQKAQMSRQYVKDMFYYYQRVLVLRNDHRPKLRSGVFGIFKSDLIKVDGFDENYQGWGNEDDDLGRRLYKAGVYGRTEFKNEFPIHMYHKPHRTGKERVNQDYYLRRIREIKAGEYKAVNGLSNPLGDDKPIIKILK